MQIEELVAYDRRQYKLHFSCLLVSKCRLNKGTLFILKTFHYVLDCGSLIPINGISNDTRTNYTTVVKVVCEEGYSLRGDDIIVCQYNSTWSSDPVCEMKGRH